MGEISALVLRMFALNLLQSKWFAQLRLHHRQPFLRMHGCHIHPTSTSAIILDLSQSRRFVQSRLNYCQPTLHTNNTFKHLRPLGGWGHSQNKGTRMTP
jgi:hypothetical protein